MNVTCNVNGNEHSFECEPRELLADVLRDRLGLTGTHLACEQGACGACTVHLDGMAVLSCLIFAVQANGRHVRTIEGVGATDQLHPLQEQLARHHGLQCGFCTPGMVLAALDLLDREAEPTRADIEEALSGNLCRCTGYAGIVDAVHAASGSVQEVGA
jgi:aerobic carbon-monoxide dehydrogenase small subunit